jgi:hypothetical protein
VSPFLGLSFTIFQCTAHSAQHDETRVTEKKVYSRKVHGRDRDADSLVKLGQVINTEQSLVGQARAEEIEKRSMVSWVKVRTALRVEDNPDKLEGPDRLVPIYPAAYEPGRVPSSALGKLKL